MISEFIVQLTKIKSVHSYYVIYPWYTMINYLFANYSVISFLNYI